jgi:hypothetical protein
MPIAASIAQEDKLGVLKICMDVIVNMALKEKSLRFVTTVQSTFLKEEPLRMSVFCAASKSPCRCNGP